MARIAHDGVIVVGAGLAGLCAALAAAPQRVLLLTGAPLNQGCSSAWAQGGMAAALSPGDTPEQHAADTVAAGAGFVDPVIARLMAEEGPAAVRALADMGAPFDRTSDGGFSQGLEAAHGRPRIARVKGDQAGRSIMDAVTARVLAARHIKVLSDRRLRGLLQDGSGRVRGVIVETGGRLVEITAAATVLTTGGIGGLYAVTTTPAELIGEGLGLDVVLRRAAPGPRLVRRVRREGASRRQVGQGLGQAVGRGGRAVREVRMDEFFF